MARVLVVEDEESLIKLVRVNLEDEGHEVVAATDGRAGLDALMSDGPFDVVVLDLMMPFTDGFEFLSNLGTKRPKILVLTARSDGYTLERARKAGVDIYMEKPYDPMKLAEMVNELAEDKS